ncbi:hypothetical protein XFEB_00801 [Xylella fastidiosa EB92.1]|nr:hypothetical protein XFEB_00801 [Xylella fastidiosa EB92.1]
MKMQRPAVAHSRSGHAPNSHCVPLLGHHTSGTICTPHEKGRDHNSDARHNHICQVPPRRAKHGSLNPKHRPH